MTLNPIEHTFDLGNSQEIKLQTNKLAKQADGSILLQQGDTMLLATVVSNKEAAEGMDYFPLSVDYREKYASTGRFPGGFLKREGRPSDYEILISRLIDRALRPLFPDDYKSETQVLVQLLSADKEIMPDALACLAASAAIAVSDIPFNGPVSEVRIARINGQFVINPALSDMENADIDLIVAATAENIMMVEGEMNEVSEAEMLEAIKTAHEAIKKQCKAQLDIAAKVEKSKTKREYNHEDSDVELHEKIKAATYDKCYEIAKAGTADKHNRKEAFSKVLEDFIASLPEEEAEEKAKLINTYFGKVQKEAVRDMVLAERSRLDGRKLDEVRPIWTEVDSLPATHGSAIFTRGETQSLTTVTLGTKMDEQLIDGAFIKGTERFLLHYNFPPFCTGEAKFLRGTSRREVGHGNLAHRALKNMLPDDADNPYVIRVVSEVLESNGSSSMATVCAGSMALMDAGIQLKKPVAGIAMGMISKGDKYAILSDILGDEDHLGDMDFKVTGTKDGITATQMDIKVDGLSYEVLTEALEQAKKGRLHILGEMDKTITQPREDYKPHVPRIEKMIIPQDAIGAVIGPGGKVIQEIQKETNTVITIEEIDSKGHVSIASEDKESIDKAISWVKGIVAEPEIGETYDGTVKNIVSFGAFVEFMPGKEALLHISEIDWKRVNSVEDELKVGDKIQVKLIGIDPKTKKMKLSRKALLPKPEAQAESN